MSKNESQTVLRLNSKTLPPTEEQREILAQAGIRMIEREVLNDGPLPEDVRQTDAIIVISAYLRTKCIEQLQRCRVISRQGTGVDKIDVKQATQQGILVTNVPDFSTEEVADHTLALLLNTARRVKDFDALMRTGHKPEDCTRLRRLRTQTLGLIGFGRIAQAVAKRARGFGMRVLAYDPKMDEETAAELGVIPANMDTIITEADFLSLLCPLTPRTCGILGMEEFRRMKSTAILVNTGRGELVDEDALAVALQEGEIAYAALDVWGVVDVFTEGGFPTDHPLFSLPNVVVTPHVSAGSRESIEDVQRRAAFAVVDVLQGRWPKYPVNPEVKPWFEIERTT